MNILHVSDIHYCPRYLDEVDRCMASVAETVAPTMLPDLIVLSGDLFDHRLELHTAPVHAALKRAQQLADIAPTIVLQGTFSHDTPGSLDVLRTLKTRHPLLVADRICQVRMYGPEFETSRDWRFDDDDPTADALISLLPTTNKADLIAAGQDSAELGNELAAVMAGWAEGNTQATKHGIPTLLVSHGTVSGSLTEHNVPMAGLDHEFTTGTLFASKADAILLGHIHKHQSWQAGGQCIAYAGSVGRLHFGEEDPKQVLHWTVKPGSATFQPIQTPARELFEQCFDHPPSLDELKACAEQPDWTKPVHARIRIDVDQDYRHAVDEASIKDLFADAVSLKIDIRVGRIQRQRTAGIADEPDTAARLQRWCEYTETPHEPVIERLRLLEALDPSTIAATLIEEAA